MRWDTIYKIVGFIAVIIGIIYTLRQLWDKRPRLKIDWERAYFPNPDGSYGPRSFAQPTPNLTIRLRNPTERTIKIQQTRFVDADKRNFVVPNNWKTVDEIPAQDHRVFVVSVPDFQKWAKDVKMFLPEKGRFVFVDGTGINHKSFKVRDLLSMNPAKLP